MKVWRNFIAYTFFAVIALSSAPSSINGTCSNSCFSHCSEACFIDDYSIAVDFLWWKPCIDDLTYATTCEDYEGKTIIEYESCCPDWEPGVRVIFGRPCFYCDWGFVASYTYFLSDNTCCLEKDAKISSPLIHQNFTDSKSALYDKAEAEWEMRYQEFDALITYDMSCCNPCHLFQPFVGVAGIYLEQDFDITLSVDESTYEIEWGSRLWGVGLRAGVEYQYIFSKCLRFFTLVHGTMLASQPENKTTQTFCTELVIKDDDCCLFLPGYHVGVGFILDSCICDVGFSLRVGYEFLEWRNIPNHRIFIGDNKAIEGGHATSSNIRTLGFHGLIAGLGVAF